MKKALFTIALGAPLFGMLGYVIAETTEMPDVYMSYSTGECVEVINYADTNYSCENFPVKFNHVWVK
jgi:hypothetical protein